MEHLNTYLVQSEVDHVAARVREQWKPVRRRRAERRRRASERQN